MSSTLALVGAASAGVTLLLLLALERWAPRLGLVDLPNARSSHARARPRGGGAAIVAGVLAGCLTLAALGLSLPRQAATVLAAALALAALGLWDDLAPLGAGPRLAMQAMVATAVVAVLGGLPRLPLPPPADIPLAAFPGAALAALWLVAVTNFFNFMDGIDGLAGGQALIAALALLAGGGVRPAAPLLWVLAVTLVVFLVFNWAPARLFMGDVGSGFLGFLLAASPWLGAPAERATNLLFVALVMSLFLLDPLWTLAARSRRGARVTESHREHLYQRLTRAARGHGRVAAALLVAATLLAALAVWSYGIAGRTWWAVGGAVLLFALEVVWARRSAG